MSSHVNHFCQTKYKNQFTTDVIAAVKNHFITAHRARKNKAVLYIDPDIIRESQSNNINSYQSQPCNNKFTIRYKREMSPAIYGEGSHFVFLFT